MSLSQFKEAIYQSNGITIIPVMPKTVTSLDQLPLTSFHFVDLKSGVKEIIHYVVDLGLQGGERYHGGRIFGTLGRHMLETMKRLDIGFDSEAHYRADRVNEFIDGVFHRRTSRDLDLPAVIQPEGVIRLALPVGATLTLVSALPAGDEPSGKRNRAVEWEHVILSGNAKVCGVDYCWYIDHSDAAGFTIDPASAGLITCAAEAAVHAEFPFLRGHLALYSPTWKHAGVIEYAKGF